MPVGDAVFEHRRGSIPDRRTVETWFRRCSRAIINPRARSGVGHG
jgi:hypothetical protein